MTTPSDTDTLQRGTRIGRTALRVNDLDELTGFYRDIVGLSVLDESDTRSVLGVADTPLLVLEGDADAPTRHRSGAGLYHTAFRVPSRAALGDALARIRTHWQLGGASDHWVSEALYLTDPEGNGIEVLKENEWNTSKTCSRCGDDTKSNHVERGLYVCSSCGLVGNADCNGAENMRQKITPSPHDEDRSNGCVAQPSTHLFDRESGTFNTREQVVS